MRFDIADAVLTSFPEAAMVKIRLEDLEGYACHGWLAAVRHWVEELRVVEEDDHKHRRGITRRHRADEAWITIIAVGRDELSHASLAYGLSENP